MHYGKTKLAMGHDYSSNGNVSETKFVRDRKNGTLMEFRAALLVRVLPCFQLGYNKGRRRKKKEMKRVT